MGRICAAIAAIVLAGGCGAPQRQAEESSPVSTSATATRPAGMTDEARFVDVLRRQGITRSADDLLLHGHTACVYLDQPRTTRLEAKDGLRDEYSYSLADAGKVVDAAVDALCPEKG